MIEHDGQVEFSSARGPRSRADLLVWPAVRAGLMGRCPACGRGPLFEGFLKRRASCEACGFDLGAVETGDGAATFIMQIAGFLVGFSALAVEIAFSPPIWLHLIVWLPLTAGLALALMRPGKGLMTALQMLRQRSDDSPRETL
ncbi:DUF983 domain-containing protein [Brevundimonas naejangsanensis]|uniref:DUF983 domain-containing protein n=3 Tax=Brevundimonas naejangsanensis TaxID=588932 RepID=UPI000EE14F1B|nr:hypothetical protein [Brevundimonas sp.]